MAEAMQCTLSVCFVQQLKERSHGQCADATVILMIYTCTSKRRLGAEVSNIASVFLIPCIFIMDN